MSGFLGDIPADGDTGEDGAHSGERIRKRDRTCGSGAVFDAHDAGWNFSGAGPITPGNFGEDGVAGAVNVRGFEASSGARNILRHGFLGPGKTQGAHEDGQRERNSGARAAFAICGSGCSSRGQIELQRDLISRARTRFDAHHARGSFRRDAGAGSRVERKHHPDARAGFAGLVALHANSIARNVERVGGFHAHAEWAAPADARRKFQLGPGMFAQFQGRGGRGHGRLS